MLTYNGQLGYFCTLKVQFSFTDGGNIHIEYEVDTAKAQPYIYDTESATARNMFRSRVFAEGLLVFLIMVTLVIELVELTQCIIKTGGVSGYFSSVWNYIDVASIAFFIVCLSLWFFVITNVEKFSTEAR